MAFLKDSKLLKIEDILPFFPDFVLIDDFKVSVCVIGKCEGSEALSSESLHFFLSH